MTKSTVAALTLLACCTHTVLADEARFTDSAPTIDGVASEAMWQSATWYPLNQIMLGEKSSDEDFSGRYTLAWDNQTLYLLAEITDDILIDTHSNPLEKYWDDDTLEVFIDADASGGLHLDDYNAFAYHIALDNQVVDIGPDKQGKPAPQLYNHHVNSAWRRSLTAPNSIIWEVAIKIYPDTYDHFANSNPIQLAAQQVIGFMLAYCDSDGPEGRSLFIGSHPIEPVNGDKNRGYIDASVFDRVTLLAPQ